MTTPSIPRIEYRRPIKYYDGFNDIKGDEKLSTRYFTYEIDAGLVAGASMDFVFEVDRPRDEVWHYARDMNLWLNPFNHFFSGVIGDLEGQTYGLSNTPGNYGPHYYHVLRVIPEYLHVIYQPVMPPGEGPPGYPGLACDGAVSPGFHVIMLSEHAGKTMFLTYMEHSALMTRDPKQMTEEQALAPWRVPSMAPEWHRKWREDFIPYVKKLIYQGKRG